MWKWYTWWTVERIFTANCSAFTPNASWWIDWHVKINLHSLSSRPRFGGKEFGGVPGTFRGGNECNVIPRGGPDWNMLMWCLIDRGESIQSWLYRETGWYIDWQPWYTYIFNTMFEWRRGEICYFWRESLNHFSSQLFVIFYVVENGKGSIYLSCRWISVKLAPFFIIF